MNAPLRIQIDDATKRKADLWDALQEGEIDAHRADRIDEALYRQSMHDRELSVRLETMSRRLERSSNSYDKDLSLALHKVARHLNLMASQYQSDREAFSDGGNAYIMPGDA